MDLYNLNKKETFLISQKALIIENNRLLVLKNTEDKRGGVSEWELPGGILDMREDLKRGLIREVKEETKLCISVGKIFTSSDNWINNFKFKDGRILNVRFIALAYFCNIISGKLKLSEEHSDFLWATKKELKKLDLAINSRSIIEKYLES